MKKVNVLNIPFLDTTDVELVNYLYENHITVQKKCQIVTANPEFLVKSNESEQFKELLLSTDYVIPDGIGVVMASKLLKGDFLKKRLSGFDLMKSLLRVAHERKLSCYFYGAKNEVLSQMITNIEREYPNMIIKGYRDGYVTAPHTVKNDISILKPDIIFVALGMPKQEIVIHEMISKVNKGVFVGVGGSFDVLAGAVKRAPKWIININLEWLYRMFYQPSRIKRNLKLLTFIKLVIKQRNLNKDKRQSIR